MPLVSFRPLSARMMSSAKAALVVAGLAIGLAGCANVGHDFPDQRARDIEIGKTSQQQVREMFGEPWRVGYEDGNRTWTYGKYHYTILGSPSTKDLVIRFDRNNVVKSYTYNTTEHDE